MKKEFERCPNILTDYDYGLRRHQVSSSSENVKDSFAIIRHPLDRFVSAAVFALRGSEKMDVNKSTKRGDFKSLSMFVESLRNSNDPYHRSAHKIYNMKKRKTGWTAFDPQTDWINETTNILCYDKDALQDNVNGFIKSRGIACDIDLKHVNVTKKEDFDVGLSKEQVEWIEEKYKDDFLLWEKHCEKTK